MADDSLQKKKPLVSVEFQTEINVATGTAERRMFVKMYFDARDSGLLAALGDRRWRTLCVLATYMDENTNCHPSQARIARDLGIHRQRVNERIQELLTFRFNGEPVVTMSKFRVQTDHGGRWANNVYQIRPVTGFSIFNKVQQQNDGNVRKAGHRPMSAKPDTGKPDTNQNQGVNQKVVNALPGNDQKVLGKGSATPVISDRALRATYQLADAQLARVHYLVQKQGDVLGAVERNHAHYVKRAAEAVAGDRADLLDMKLSEFKQATAAATVTSPPAYFNAMWIEALDKRQGDAGGRSSRARPTTTCRSGFEPVRSILRASGSYGEERPEDESTLA